MDGSLLEAFVDWARTSCVSLTNHGWKVTLEDFEEGDLVILGLESREFIGRFALQDTGRVEIGVRDKRTPDPRRGVCEVYTKAQLEDALNQFLGWLSDKPEADAQITCPHRKKVFGSRGEAEASLKRQMLSRPGMQRMLETYKCHLCHQWHIGGLQGRVEMVRRTIAEKVQKPPRRRRRP